MIRRRKAVDMKRNKKKRKRKEIQTIEGSGMAGRVTQVV